MITITKEKLDKILENHKHWIKQDCDGWEKTRAHLQGANLTGVNLYLTNLCGADLRGANLNGTYLAGANLYRADLTGANLTGANLYRANLTGANLQGANLNGADLYKAHLSLADLRGANMCGAINVPPIPYTCPDSGRFIGWKKAGGKIICLEIPEDAKRLSATGRKCRCNKAKVLSISNLDGSACEETEVSSDRDKSFIYKVGETVSVPNFDDNRWNECSTGIHFFINREEAVYYSK